MDRNDKLSELGAFIKNRRNQLRLTQSEVAQKVGVSEVTIRKYESGDRKPKLQQILGLSNALSVSIEKFLELLEPEMQAANIAKIDNEADKPTISFKDYLKLVNDYVRNDFYEYLIVTDKSKKKSYRLSAMEMEIVEKIMAQTLKVMIENFGEDITGVEESFAYWDED